MHIAFLTTEFPCRVMVQTGGIGTTIRNQARILLSNNIRVTILLWVSQYFEDFVEESINIYCIPQMKTTGFLGVLRKQIDLSKRVNDICERQDIDIIETADWEGNIAFGRYKVPVITRLHGSNLFFGRLLNKNVPLGIGLLERMSICQSDAYVGVSQQSYSVSNSIFHFKKSKPSTIIYNPIDLNHVDSFCFDKIPNKRIIFYGTLVEKKGVLLLPEIFNEVIRHHPDASLTIVGKDTDYGGSSMKAHLESMFSDKALKRTQIINHLAYDDLLREVANHDICLLPSYAETFGLVLLEGMTLKKAVVCSDIEPFMEIARDGIDCIHCPSGDSESFTRAILDVIEDKDKYISLAENASKRAFAKFAPEKLAQQHINFYNLVLEKCHKG